MSLRYVPILPPRQICKIQDITSIVTRSRALKPVLTELVSRTKIIKQEAAAAAAAAAAASDDVE